MARKRKTVTSKDAEPRSTKVEYDIEERFDDSEDEFYAGRDKVLLDDGPAAKRRRRIQEEERNILPSDEEILAQSESDEDDFDDARSEQDENEEQADENWGTTKADYYNTDVIETEADALDEEKEARRIQQKQLKSMTNADFGFDETTWTQSEPQEVARRPVVEKLPESRLSPNADKDELVKALHNRYPEFQFLARDLSELQVIWRQLRAQAINAGSDSKAGVTARTKLNALTSYLGAIAMYFAVITSTANPNADPSKITAIHPSELRDHSIIHNLMLSRTTWDTVKDIGVEAFKDRAESVPVSDDVAKPKIADRGTRKTRKEEPRDQEEVFSDFEGSIDMPQLPSKPKKTKLVNLQSLLTQSAAPEVVSEDKFGDEDPLTEQQAAEKARKKKSLRFYTSQIAQKANKRGAASREAGGDDDVPRKERLRDRQERLLKEAERRGNEPATREEELRGDSEGEMLSASGDEYYNSLVAGSRRKKAEKQAKAEAYAEAAKQGGKVNTEERIGPDGKRKITYAIEANKGLTPKRRKDVRNPRVKRRKQFDEKMKKLGSIRQVYKGGEGRGGYKGELTGIKTNIVKSVKL